jgi:hypothetical protein
MSLAPIDPLVLFGLTAQNIEDIKQYIESPMTATTFSKALDKARQINREAITSEVLYYRMIAHNIPFECQKWHLNRLLTLMRVCDIKSQPNKKGRINKSAVLRNYAQMNAARRARLHSKG